MLFSHQRPYGNSSMETNTFSERVIAVETNSVRIEETIIATPTQLHVYRWMTLDKMCIERLPKV